jgi:sugar phosphate isomerase/epimerase
MAKLGIGPGDLRRIAPRHLGWVELSDGFYESRPDLIDETVNHRKLPGEGEFPIRDYVAACREAGYSGPWGIEVLSEELRNLPIDKIFDRAYATASAQLVADHERSTSV